MTLNCSGDINFLRILPLSFKLRSLGINFPAFSGSIWHGGLGMQLERHAPEAFRKLFQCSPESRLYALLPPVEKIIPSGSLFVLRVTLFGSGTESALSVAHAIAELGRVGLRPGGHYEVLGMQSFSPEGVNDLITEKQGIVALPQASSMADFISITPSPEKSCRIQFKTPLRIKEGNDFVRSAPSYAQLIKRIFGRVDQLAHAAGEITPLEKKLRGNVLEEAEKISIRTADLREESLIRRSGRSNEQMQFSGITGSVNYAGPLQHSIPWLQLASLIQLGGKTAFGFGGVQIAISENLLDGEAL